MDDDLILAVGSRGRGKGEFTNPQVLIMMRRMSMMRMMSMMTMMTMMTMHCSIHTASLSVAIFVLR